MTISQLILNAECELYGATHKVVTINPPHVWLKRPDGESIQIEYLTLITEPSFKPLKSMSGSRTVVPFEGKLAKLTEKKRNEVSARFDIIRPIEVLEKIKNGDYQSVIFFRTNYRHLMENESENLESLTQNDLVERIKKHHGIARSTIMRHLATYRADGEEGLASNKGQGTHSRKDNRLLIICDPDNQELILDTITVRLSEDQSSILKEVIENEYLTKLRIKKATVKRRADIKCAELKVPEIKYVTICGIIKRLNDKIKLTYREPSKAKRIYDEVARGYADREALGRLDIIQVDHTKLDMPARDDKTGLVIERPWLTLGIDVFTREPWCMILSAEGPSENVVRKAIQHGVFPKHSKREYGTQKEWAASGIPNIIYVDNGMDFKGNDIKRLVNETLKSDLRHRPVRLPHYGAIIERFIGTINREVIHEIWGTTKSNIVEKGDLDPEEECFLTMSELRKILMTYLVDIYPYKPHRGLPHDQAPRVRFIESVKEMGYPHIIFDDERENYEIEFLYTDKKPYTREGVRWENRIYKSADCQDIIGPGKDKQIVKYDIDNIGSIYLLHPKSKKFIKLYCENPPYEMVAGVNRYTYKLLEKTLRKEGLSKLKEILDEDQIQKGWASISKQVKDGYTRNKKTRQQVARMGNSVEIDVSTPYSEHQVKNVRKAAEEFDIEEQLLNEALEAEKNREGTGF